MSKQRSGTVENGNGVRQPNSFAENTGRVASRDAGKRMEAAWINSHATIA
jgi:hypothetical protein